MDGVFLVSGVTGHVDHGRYRGGEFVSGDVGGLPRRRRERSSRGMPDSMPAGWSCPLGGTTRAARRTGRAGAPRCPPPRRVGPVGLFGLSDKVGALVPDLPGPCGALGPIWWITRERGEVQVVAGVGREAVASRCWMWPFRGRRQAPPGPRRSPS